MGQGAFHRFGSEDLRHARSFLSVFSVEANRKKLSMHKLLSSQHMKLNDMGFLLFLAWICDVKM